MAVEVSQGADSEIVVSRARKRRARSRWRAFLPCRSGHRLPKIPTPADARSQKYGPTVPGTKPVLMDSSP